MLPNKMKTIPERILQNYIHAKHMNAQTNENLSNRQYRIVHVAKDARNVVIN